LNVARLTTTFVDAPSKASAAPVSDSALVVPTTVDGQLAIWTIGQFLRKVDAQLTQFGQEVSTRLNLRDTIVAVIAWLTLAFVFQTLATNEVQRKIWSAALSASSRLQLTLGSFLAFLKRQPSLNWQNLGFVVILVTGLFLSLAAITSLPRLREN